MDDSGAARARAALSVEVSRSSCSEDARNLSQLSTRPGRAPGRGESPLGDSRCRGVPSVQERRHDPEEGSSARPSSRVGRSPRRHVPPVSGLEGRAVSRIFEAFLDSRGHARLRIIGSSNITGRVCGMYGEVGRRNFSTISVRWSDEVRPSCLLCAGSITHARSY